MRENQKDILIAKTFILQKSKKLGSGSFGEIFQGNYHIVNDKLKGLTEIHTRNLQ
jgi:hypothetical protein